MGLGLGKSGIIVGLYARSQQGFIKFSAVASSEARALVLAQDL